MVNEAGSDAARSVHPEWTGKAIVATKERLPNKGMNLSNDALFSLVAPFAGYAQRYAGSSEVQPGVARWR